ncbi:MAG: hypothetical protein PHX78_10365 [bacterium]|nr:hypothetical protein [bacterium]
MRKLSISILAAAMFMGLVSLSSAADVKISGKVDVRQELGGLTSTDAAGEFNKTSYNLKAFNLREARLTAKATLTDKISAQISNNFCATNVATLEAANAGIGNTYINMAIGGGNLVIGATSIPGFAIRETIANKECLGNKLTTNSTRQVAYNGKADMVSYAIAIVDGSYTKATANGVDVAGNAATAPISKDAVINLGAEVSGAQIGVTYNADTNDDDGVKGSFFAANVGYKLNPVDLTVQFIGGLDKKVTGGATETDIADPTKAAPTSEIVLAVGYKIGERHDLSLGYDMFGKSSAITLKANCKIADGVTGILRADVLGSKLKDIDPVANNISLGIAAEF